MFVIICICFVVIPGGSTSSASVVGVNGQMGNYSYGYAGVANLEKAFRVSS